MRKDELLQPSPHSGDDLGQKGVIPLSLKVIYSLFMAILIPFYWFTYGPTNFLYFCDVAIILTLLAIWRENRLLVSMAAVGILIPQIVWVVDFSSTLLGFPLIGMTEYMFRESIPIFARGLSSFHGWIPFLLVYLIYKLGYDKKALLYWTVLAWALMGISYYWLPAPGDLLSSPNIPVNVNYVYGLEETKAQTMMSADRYFILLLVFMPLVIYWPTSRCLQWFDRRYRKLS